jgi:hypothetical protein
MGNNAWEMVTFVPTQAAGGNSNQALNYTYTDLNSSRNVSQYRIRQSDIDGRITYSPIRSVHGEGQNGKVIIYPNPSQDGSINVLFESKGGITDVTLTDMSGRLLKQVKAVESNSVRFDNLNRGMYLVRILDRETGIQTVEKIIVNGNQP